MERNKKGFYSVDGVDLRSSTTILNVLEKHALHPWIAKTTAEQIRDFVLKPIIAGEMTPQQLAEMDLDLLMTNAKTKHKKVKSESADMGSLIHRVISEYYKAGSDPTILNSYTQSIPELTAPILAFMEWQAKYKIVPKQSEHTVFSRKYKYAGTLDLECLGVLKGDPDYCQMVVDFKSSSGIYDEMVLQLASYVFAHEEMAGHEIAGGMIVRLDKETGVPEDRFYPRESLLSPFVMFLALADYCDYRDRWMSERKASRKKDKKK